MYLYSLIPPKQTLPQFSPMEDTYTKPHTTSQTPNPKQPFLHSMSKPILFLVFIFILPLFSSQFSETTEKTTIWEVIQLFFVVIAVFFGLFSRKNNESEDFDKVNSCLSNFLQVSSFFENGEDDNQPGLSENYAVEMWKSKYSKVDSMVVLENENLGFGNREKPLLLPVRSLKSEVLETDFPEKVKKLDVRKHISSSVSKHLSMDFTKSRNMEFGKIGYMDFVPKVDENLFREPELRYDSKSEEIESEIKCENNGSVGNRSERSLKGVKFGKSVRTFRKRKSAYDDYENGGVVEDINLMSEKIFDFRDYEKGKSEEMGQERNLESKELDCNSESGEGRDVDKKADEFIAKFREQIRLQKTESFRR